VRDVLSVFGDAGEQSAATALGVEERASASVILLVEKLCDWVGTDLSDQIRGQVNSEPLDYVGQSSLPTKPADTAGIPGEAVVSALRIVPLTRGALGRLLGNAKAASGRVTLGFA
jgi:hypothetical protein